MCWAVCRSTRASPHADPTINEWGRAVKGAAFSHCPRTTVSGLPYTHMKPTTKKTSTSTAVAR